MLWVKAFHVIAVMSWMAGLLYLPRLMVYHVEASIGSEKSETFKIMERRLLKAIMNPAMLVSWVLGLWLAFSQGLFTSGEVWFYLKFLSVIVMTIFHMIFAKHVRLFAADQNEKTGRYYRVLNEGPTVLMIAIVVLVIIKPL
ncbi:MAG: protoporphyrinogen oxidase HemJ [Pseudomonadota bacterium]